MVVFRCPLRKPLPSPRTRAPFASQIPRNTCVTLAGDDRKSLSLWVTPPNGERATMPQRRERIEPAQPVPRASGGDPVPSRSSSLRSPAAPSARSGASSQWCRSSSGRPAHINLGTDSRRGVHIETSGSQLAWVRKRARPPAGRRGGRTTQRATYGPVR